MDAPYYNGEPGAMPYDEERDEHYNKPRHPRELRCDDCAALGTDGYTLVGTTAKMFCDSCARRRGLAYLFDARPWAQIEAAQQKGAA